MFRGKFNCMRSRKSGYITKYSALSKLGKRSELSTIHFKNHYQCKLYLVLRFIANLFPPNIFLYVFTFLQ